MAARLTALEQYYRAIPEKQLLTDVRALVKVLNGLVYHTFSSLYSEKGFPDLTIVIKGRVIFAELKREIGKVTPEQTFWLDHLALTGANAYLWRPSHWDEIVRILNKGPTDNDVSRWRPAA